MTTVTRLRAAENAEFEDLIDRCVRYRNSDFSKFCDIYRDKYPKIGRRLPTEIVRDVLRDVCGYVIDERPLPKGQLALCDFRTRKIKLNSRPGHLLGHGEDLLIWQRCVLAHELGHIRLHTDEMESGCYISSNLDQGFDDPRFFQKEFEAELYAAIFLVPLELLEKSQRIQLKRQKLQDSPNVASPQVWDLVSDTARLFGITKDLMRLALEVHGWISFEPQRKFAKTGKLKLIPQRD